jgi:hypothetical protein
MSDPRQLVEEGHERAGLRLIRRAIHGRWDIPDVLLEQLPKHVTALLVGARNDREKLRAAEVLVSMNRDNIAALVHADKIERLDSGKATDRVETMQSISDAQLSAAARIIARRMETDGQDKPKEEDGKKKKRKK